MDITRVPVWVIASIRKHLNAKLQDKAKVYYEGDDRTTNNYPEFLEVRIDGPYTDNCGTKDELSIYSEVNILINTTRNERNIFATHSLMGIATQLLNGDICIYQIGHPDDTGEYYCTLQHIETTKNSYFGQIDPNSQVQQSSVEAHYMGYI